MRFALAFIVLSACGSSGSTWTTFHSAACDSTFELMALPVSTHRGENTYFGDSVAVAHGIEREDKSRFIYGCRFIPPAYWTTTTEAAVAEQVLDGELTTFDASWSRGAKQTDPDGTLRVELTRPDGQAEVRMRGYAADARTHGTVVSHARAADAKRFVAGIQVDPPRNGPVTVRSAECLASVTMPGWPTGSVMPPIVTERYNENMVREWQLRCVFLSDSDMRRTPAELFAQAEADTLRGAPFTLASKADVEVDGRPGRDFRFESIDKTRAMDVRIVVDGDRIQAATYDAPLAEQDVGRRFVTSLRLLRPKP